MRRESLHLTSQRAELLRDLHAAFMHLCHPDRQVLIELHLTDGALLALGEQRQLSINRRGDALETVVLELPGPADCGHGRVKLLHHRLATAAELALIPAGMPGLVLDGI